MVNPDNGIQVLNLRRLSGESTLKAFADLLFANVFIVKGLKVVEGKNGLFVSMPQRQDKEGKWRDIAFPTTKEFRGLLSDIVLSEYERKQ
ncbi:septation protein SpoVG family protein [Candidatus Omnitrophota bacterium]